MPNIRKDRGNSPSWISMYCSRYQSMSGTQMQRSQPILRTTGIKDMVASYRFLSLFAVIFSACSASENGDSVVPAPLGSRYTLTVQNTVMEIDPAIGGRITSLRLDGTNFFTDSSVNSFN